MNNLELQLLRELTLDNEKFETLEYVCRLTHELIEEKIPFNQVSLSDSQEYNQYPDLVKIGKKYGGLCDIIVNFVIKNDLLGNKTYLFQNNIVQFVAKYKSNTYFSKEFSDQRLKLFRSSVMRVKNPLSQLITLKNLNAYAKTHLLEITSFFNQARMYFTNEYPYNLFPNGNILIKNKVNLPLLQEKLETLPDGQYVKLILLNKKLSFSGHIVAIKKTKNGFSFFDPSNGEIFNLNISQLATTINRYIGIGKPTHLVFLDGTQLLYALSKTHQLNHESEIQSIENQETSDELAVLSALENIFQKEEVSEDQTLIKVMRAIGFEINEPQFTDDILQYHLLKKTEYKLYELSSKLYQYRRELWQRKCLDNQFYLFQANTVNVNDSADIQRLMNSMKNCHGLFYNFEQKKLYYVDPSKDNITLIELQEIVERLNNDLQFAQLFRTNGFANRGMKETITASIGIFIDPIPLNKILDLSSQLLCSAYDLAFLTHEVPLQTWEVFFHGNQEDCLSILSTFRQIYLFFQHSDKACHSIVYDAIKYNFSHLIESVWDFNRIIRLLPQEQNDDLFSFMQPQLVNLITSISDLSDALEFLSTSTREELFNVIEKSLDLLLTSKRFVLRDFRNALKFLNSNQQSILMQAFKRNLINLSMEITDLSDITGLLASLSPEEAQVLLEINFVQIPRAMIKETVQPSLNKKDSPHLQIIRLLTNEQWKMVCDALFANGYEWIKAYVISYFLVNMHEDSPEKAKYFFDSIQDNLTEIIHSSRDFNDAIICDEVSINEIYQSVFYKKMEKLLPAYVQTHKDLENILPALTNDQSLTLISNPSCLIVLSKCFIDTLPSVDAKALSIALIRDDADGIKQICNRFIKSQRYPKYSLSWFTQSNTKIDLYATQLDELDYFWLVKINKALELNLDNNILYRRGEFKKYFLSDFITKNTASMSSKFNTNL